MSAWQRILGKNCNLTLDTVDYHRKKYYVHILDWCCWSTGLELGLCSISITNYTEKNQSSDTRLPLKSRKWSKVYLKVMKLGYLLLKNKNTYCQWYNLLIVVILKFKTV